MPSDPITSLAEFLTAHEAGGLAAQLESGAHLSHALGQIAPNRRVKAKALLESAGLGSQDTALSVAVLKAVAGAKTSTRLELTPVWTMPDGEADLGGLTSQFHHAVTAARVSVTCASFNFTYLSEMWTALKEASETPGVMVTLYVDSQHADTAQIKSHLPKANVYGSRIHEGQQVVSHAKFIVLDHELVLLTSANFSKPAEKSNVELGLRIHDAGLAETIESTMAGKHSSLYELVN